MCINKLGFCESCGRDFQGEIVSGSPCPVIDDCPSHYEEVGINHPLHTDATPDSTDNE